MWTERQLPHLQMPTCEWGRTEDDSVDKILFEELDKCQSDLAAEFTGVDLRDLMDAGNTRETLRIALLTAENDMIVDSDL